MSLHKIRELEARLDKWQLRKMEKFFILTQSEFRRWVKEAIKDYYSESAAKEISAINSDEPFLTRREIAKKLRVFLVTFTEWVKHGLPSHKQRGRVYFLHSE